MAGLLVYSQPGNYSPLQPRTGPGPKRLCDSQETFPPGSGLTRLQTCRLVHSLLLPAISYGADLFVPNGAMAYRLDVLWYKALRWATNCFSSIPVMIPVAEVTIPPLPVLFRHKRRTAAMVMACTPSPLNPAAARLPNDFPAPLPRSTDDTSRPPAWKRRNAHHA